MIKMAGPVKDFDVLHKVADEYFHRPCDKNNKIFTHLVGTENGHFAGYFYINYDSSKPIDVLNEYHVINNILGESDTDNLWRKIRHFEVKETEP